MKENTFVKTHGLGNEYIVLDSDNISFQLTEKAIKRICNVNFGIGSDGILLKVPSDKADSASIFMIITLQKIDSLLLKLKVD